MDIAKRVYKGLRSGSNVHLSLPSGLGKTLISQIIATTWTRLPPENSHKILVIVPGRLSLNLYPAHTSWLEKFVKLGVLDNQANQESAETNLMLDKFDMLICTPRKLINGLIHNEIPFARLKEYSLVILEDYDTLLNSKYSQASRVTNDIDMLMTFLASSAPRFLFLSANTQPMSSQHSEWETILKPIRIEVNSTLYQDFIPLVNIRLKGVIDPEVETADKLLNRRIARNLGQIKNSVVNLTKNKHPIRVREILVQMRDIASGKQKDFYIHFRKSPTLIVPVSNELKEAFLNVSKAVMTRIQLFEDLWFTTEPVSRDIDHDPPLGGRQVNLFGKMKAVREIVVARSNRHGLLLTRNMEMCELLAGTIINQGLPVYILHKDLTPVEQKKRLEGFREQKAAVLLTPRLFGGRNLDISMVDYAVFYSPKDEEETMWQEMAGIQSSRKNTKEVFILFYRNTGEEMKLKRLLWKMKGRANYRFLKAEVSNSWVK